MFLRLNFTATSVTSVTSLQVQVLRTVSEQLFFSSKVVLSVTVMNLVCLVQNTSLFQSAVRVWGGSVTAKRKSNF